eukprot:TRINITY_DN5500_c0_g1_i5.p1 TRINITY_DN5500_c0_g1~~TRINITY_DN5500_c0_g1_i5.p1  ORF type:complete len:597 (-),score=144.01 TRINITY_DN5500_c0_g1_i5:486-2276(-)
MPPVIGDPTSARDGNERSPQLMKLLREWDKGSKQTRERILQNFITNNANKTGPQLERELGNGASLFLTRISAWLRLTYLLGYSISLQLSSISIFVTASSGHRFLTEFVEVGGIMTVMEILTIEKILEVDKRQALHLLLSIANAGRKYKEMMCDNDGIRTLTDFLKLANDEETFDALRYLFHNLGTGNPRYVPPLQRALLSILPVQKAGAQKVAAQTLRFLTSQLPPDQQFLQPIMDMFKSPDLQVQYEGIELLKKLITFGNLSESIIVNLIRLLAPNLDMFGATDSVDVMAASSSVSTRLPSIANAPQQRLIPASYVQQATAAKVLGSFASLHNFLAKMIVDKDGVSGLMFAIANTSHLESQKNAGVALDILIEHYPEVLQAMEKQLGADFMRDFQGNKEVLFKSLSAERIEKLKAGLDRVEGFEQLEKGQRFVHTALLAQLERMPDTIPKFKTIAEEDSTRGTIPNSASQYVPFPNLDDPSTKVDGGFSFKQQSGIRDREEIRDDVAAPETLSGTIRQRLVLGEEDENAGHTKGSEKSVSSSVTFKPPSVNELRLSDQDPEGKSTAANSVRGASSFGRMIQKQREIGDEAMSMDD